MKKRLISFLLAAVLALSLGVSAFADNAAPAEATTEIVTVKKGDTMYSICQARGYNYNNYTELLVRLNRMKDESSLAKITAGKKIEVPVSQQAADALMKSLNIKAPTTKKNLKGADAFVAGDATKVPQGDAVKYYLVRYALQKDENLKELIESWGLKFNDVSEKILTLNDLKDFNHIPAGRDLLLPTAKLDLTGCNYYSVMEHTVKKGDTAYSLCKTYGLDYDKALATLEKLNPGVTFTKIKVNQKLCFPVGGLYGQLSPTPSASPAPSATDYTGTGVIISIGTKLCIRPEQGDDFNLVVLNGAFPTGYVPRLGDYVMFHCDTSINALKAIKFIYNAFDTNK